MQGLWVAGVFFGLAFLMVVGLHSVLRELFARGPDPVNQEDNLEGFDRENESMSVQAPRV
jgi:hypothetical protein